MSQYFFQLGREREIALAELGSYLRTNNYQFVIDNIIGNVAVLDIDKISNPVDLISKLGGIVRLGRITKEQKYRTALTDYLTKTLNADHIFKNYLITSRRIIFGLSFMLDNAYRLSEQAKIIRWSYRAGLALKKDMRSDSGRSCRFMALKDQLSLSSVVVAKNKMTAGGLEIAIIASKSQVYLGQTLAVQPFAQYRRRDIDRPCRSMKTGMLPPKLAQVMINLAGLPKEATIYDPFVGLGTVLAEARLLGYQYYGSDYNPAMVAASQKNLLWLGDKMAKCKIFLSAAQTAARYLKVGTIDGLVSEGDLGPIYHHQPTTVQIKRNWQELDNLYSFCFKEWHEILPKQGPAVITLPVYQPKAKIPVVAPFLDKIIAMNYNLTKPLDDKIVKKFNLRLSPRGTLIYARPGQKVGREIIIFKRR